MPTVVVNGVTLTLVSSTNTTVVANMPSSPALPPGSYILTVTASEGNPAAFTVTNGAVGPQGPMGATGATGAAGANGAART